jgi:hypothetical protein
LRIQLVAATLRLYHRREEDVADEAKNADLLHRRAESADVGTLAEWRFHEHEIAIFPGVSGESGTAG